VMTETNFLATNAQKHVLLSLSVETGKYKEQRHVMTGIFFQGTAASIAQMSTDFHVILKLMFVLPSVETGF